MYIIRNGTLLPPERFASLDEALWIERVAAPVAPSPGEMCVVVASAVNPIVAIPRAVVTIATIDEDETDVRLLWARNEDDGGREVVVAWDDLSVTKSWVVPPTKEADNIKRWTVLSLDAWSRMPFGNEPVRLFRNAEEASTALHDEVVYLPVSDPDGWQGIVAHGYGLYNGNSPWRSNSPLREMLGLPEGILIESLPNNNVRSKRLFRDQSDPYRAEGAWVVRAAVTPDGGIHLTLCMGDGAYGYKFVCRAFSHDEALERLTL
jgi:hypothetical protein